MYASCACPRENARQSYPGAGDHFGERRLRRARDGQPRVLLESTAQHGLRVVTRLSACGRGLPSLICTPTLRLPSICKTWLPSICKTGVRTTIRKSPRSCGFALPEVTELTIAGIAPVLTLQTVGIVVGGCRRGGKSDSHKCCGSNDPAHIHLLS
jgi:hypothetical protein